VPVVLAAEGRKRKADEKGIGNNGMTEGYGLVGEAEWRHTGYVEIMEKK